MKTKKQIVTVISSAISMRSIARGIVAYWKVLQFFINISRTNRNKNNNNNNG